MWYYLVLQAVNMLIIQKALKMKIMITRYMFTSVFGYILVMHLFLQA